MKELECSQDFSHYKSMGIFPDAQGQLTQHPYLKSPHHTCGTPHNICGTPQVHVEFLRNQCGIPQCFAELRKGFTTCGTCSTSHIGIFSASIRKICGKFRLSFFTYWNYAESIDLNNFHIGKYLRKIYTAEILDLDDFTSGKCLRNIFTAMY